MSIDFSKPVQTRDGRPVRILCTDRPFSDYPVVGLVSDTMLVVWSIRGEYVIMRRDNPLDLVNVPQRHKHADVIIAWANGAKIEMCCDSSADKWREVLAPSWAPFNEYRVKP